MCRAPRRSSSASWWVVTRRPLVSPATAGREHGVGVAETVGEAEPQPMGGNDLAGAVRADQGHVPAGVGAHLIGVAQYLVGSDGVELVEPIEHRDLDSHAYSC